MEEQIYYRRNLPHYQPVEATFFITFRLANSLPLNIIKELKSEYEEELRKLRTIKSLPLNLKAYMNIKNNISENSINCLTILQPVLNG